MQVTRFRKSGGRGGFTLLELMFSMTILVIGVMAAFTSQLGSLSVVTTGQETSTGTMELQAAMEALLAREPDDMVVAFPPGVPIPAFADRNLRNESVIPAYPNWGGAGSLPAQLDVVLMLTWEDFEGRQRQLRLATAVAR